MRLPASVRLRSPLLLFLIAVFIYNLNGRTLGGGDSLPARYLPFSIIKEFNFDFDEFSFLYEPEVPDFLQKRNGHIISTYPPWAAVLAVPVYLVPVLGGLSPKSPLVPLFEKFAATLITALSVMVFYLALQRMTHERVAWLIALIYAFGTSSFSTSSQALWQHGPSQLFLALTIYCLVRGLEEPVFSAYAGFALASAVICRPTNVLIALPIGAYIFHKRRDQLIGFLLATVPPLCFFIAYNNHYFGSPFTTGFASNVLSPSSIWHGSSGHFSTPLLEGVLGVLASPGRGLLIYSPILLFSFVGMAMVWRKPDQVLLKYLSLAPFPIILLTGKWVNWWGSRSYGPRLLADITPILCLYLYLPFERAGARALLRYGLAGLSALSISLHALGAFSDGSWNANPGIDLNPARLWSWADSPPVYYGRRVPTSVRQVLARYRWIVSGLPTSLQAPQKLAASYSLISVAPGPTLYPHELLTVHINALNSGGAVWLANSEGGRGAVYLAWRWMKADQMVTAPSGREFLNFDLFPGRYYDFIVKIAPPQNPGEYILELGLVSEHVTRFSDQGIDPLQVAIHVATPP
ncbi:MAG: glycosyltransferase family 39 protein [candidate division NC10 bacterium]|nr:glycosyltransferase family 39 protein [candidate division NC10 bacterium]